MAVTNPELRFKALVDGLDEKTKANVVLCLQAEIRAEQEVAAAEQTAAAAEVRQGVVKSAEGLGGLIMQVHPVIAAHCRSLDGMDLAGSRADREWLMRKFPETRVKAVGTRIQVGPGTGKNR